MKGSTTLFSVVIPARNEEKCIGRCIDSILASAETAKAKIELIVVLNRCTDNTEKIAVEKGAKTVICNSKNLSAIRNSGASCSTGDVIVTVDADSIVSPNLFSQLIKELEEERIVGGSALLLPQRYSLGIAFSFLALYMFLLLFRVSVGLFFCRRKAYNDIKGFNEALCSAEDLDFARRLKKYAKKKRKKFSILWNVRVYTSTRKFDKLGDWYFLIHPFKTFKLLLGKDQKLADEIWYEFQR